MDTTFRRVRRFLIAAVLGLAAACGGDSPTGPANPPPPSALAIVCPTPIDVVTTTAPVPVTFGTPQVSGGTAPLTTTCTPESGGTFPKGSTDVICRVTDAQQRTAQCVTGVTIAIAPRLQGTRFLAFGDSMTEGEVSQPLTTIRVVEPQNSYPTALGGLLRERYVLQIPEIEVVNRGRGGASAIEDEDRLVQEVASVQPDALLLLQGVNDVNGGKLPAAVIATSLRADISRAYRMGVKKVFISTLLPQVEGRPKAFYPDRVPPVNDEIRWIAEREGAVLVDAYAAFDPQKELLIGVDGLHPTAEGYTRLAQLFMDAITQTFEVPAEGGPAPQSLFRRPVR